MNTVLFVGKHTREVVKFHCDLLAKIKNIFLCGRTENKSGKDHFRGSRVNWYLHQRAIASTVSDNKLWQGLLSA